MLEDVVVDEELFLALLQGRGVSPSMLKDEKKLAKEAGAVSDACKIQRALSKTEQTPALREATGSE